MLKGAIIFGAVGLLIGAAFLVPAVSATLLSMNMIGAPMAASIASGAWWPMGVEALSFAIFGALVPPLQKIWGACFGDNEAKQAAFQLRENASLETRVAALEQAVHAPAVSVPIQSLLAQGPRNTISFAHAEVERAAQATASPTIH